MIWTIDFLDQKGGSAGGKTWKLSESLLEVKLTGLANGLAVPCEEKRSSQFLGSGFKD